MRTTIDKAGRVVIPKSFRDAIGLTVGEVEVTRDGAGIRIEPAIGSGTVEEHGRLVIDEAIHLTDDDVRAYRSADQH